VQWLWRRLVAGPPIGEGKGKEGKSSGKGQVQKESADSVQNLRSDNFSLLFLTELSRHGMPLEPQTAPRFSSTTPILFGRSCCALCGLGCSQGGLDASGRLCDAWRALRCCPGTFGTPSG